MNLINEAIGDFAFFGMVVLIIITYLFSKRVGEAFSFAKSAATIILAFAILVVMIIGWTYELNLSNPDAIKQYPGTIGWVEIIAIILVGYFTYQGVRGNKTPPG